MVTRIGSIFSCMLFIACALAAQEKKVELALYDLEQNSLDALGVGQSVVLNVKIKGHMSDPNVKVHGLEHFHVEPRGNFRQVTVINGKTESVHEFNFLLRSYELGLFVIGPVDCDGITYPVSLEVPVGEKGHQNNRSSLFLEYQVQQEKIMVGQKIPVKIVLYSSIPAKLQNMILPKPDATLGEFSELQKDSEGTQIIGGKEYRYCSWNTELTIHKAGKIVIPECVAQCRVKNARSHSMFGGLLFDIMGGYQEKDIYSAPLVLNVADLPPFSAKVHGIGSFFDFKACIDKTTISLEEGIALTLQVGSSSYMNQVKRPDLILPEGLKYYNSSERVYQTQHGYIKAFEYILQPTKPGHVIVPQQFFNFFNPEIEQYSTLSSEPFVLDIEGVVSSQNVSAHEKKVAPILQEENNSLKIHPINERGPWRHSPARKMSGIFFALLSSLGILFLLYMLLRQGYAYYSAQYTDFYRAKYAFAHAHKNLSAVYNSQNYNHVQEIFVDLFSKRFGLLRAEITEEKINALLKDRGMAVHQQEDWALFYQHVCSVRYGVDKQISETILADSKKWLRVLEEII